MDKKLRIAAVAAVTVGLAAGQSPATARRAPEVTTLTNGVAGPFNLAVAKHDLLIADGFQNKVFRWHRGKLHTMVAKAPGAAGVDISRKPHMFAYTTSKFSGDPEQGGEAVVGTVQIRRWNGEHVATANALAYEKAHNPDKVNHYGLRNPTACQRATLKKAGFPVSYRGAIDSHPYSVAHRRGSWILADAGGNDLLRVSRSGHLSTLAVLPPQRATITRKAADQLGLAHCIVGKKYGFEPVPTDVEVRKGMLYVTTLPGGPESTALGARGAAWRLNPRNGALSRLAGGLAGATNLAVTRNGHVYVAELFAGRITQVWPGPARKVVDLPNALSVEAGRNSQVLYAGTIAPDQKTPGSVVRIRLGMNSGG